MTDLSADLLSTLTPEQMKLIVSRALDAGVLDKQTMAPVERHCEYILGSHGVFEIPSDCDRSCSVTITDTFAYFGPERLKRGML
jgi:hypothetical protein